MVEHGADYAIKIIESQVFNIKNTIGRHWTVLLIPIKNNELSYTHMITYTRIL